MITLENLTKSFTSRTGTVVALDDVTLEVSAGALLGVLGAGGAGKSTLARCVALRERPDRGVIRVAGTNVLTADRDQLRSARRQIGVLPSGDTDLAGLASERTVAGNVAAPLELAGLGGAQRRVRVAELLDLVGLIARANQHPHELSAGQRQRAALARALATGPAVLLADEPTTGLPTEDVGGVLTVLERAQAELGVTVLLTSRHADVIRRVCDEVAVLEHGRLVEHGRLMDLIGVPGSATAAEILPAVPLAGVGGHDRVTEVVLIGFAAVGALLPEAGNRFGVQISVLGGGLTRLGDTPVARFGLGLRGERSDAALAWIAEHGAVVTQTAQHGPQDGPRGVAA